MAAPYRTLLDRGAAAVDAVHGERVRVEPKTGNQHAGTLDDNSRTAVELTGVLRLTSGETGNLGLVRKRENTEMGTGGSVFHIARASLPEAAVIKKHDVLTALDYPGAPKFEVVRVNNRGRARLVLTLSAIGGSNA